MAPFINSLWFEKGTKEAVEWYVSLFPDSRITATKAHDARTAPVSGQPEGSLSWIAFTLNGQPFIAINGGAQPWAKPSAFISFIIECVDQAEIDRYWDAFSDGGAPMACGWITDRYGVTWQVVPKGLDDLTEDPKAMAAMLRMEKIDIAGLTRAREEE